MLLTHRQGLVSGLILAFLFTDTLFLARATGLLRLPQELTEIQRIRQGAAAVVRQYEELARQSGVDEDPEVKAVLASWRRQGGSVLATVDIARLVSHSREVQRVISQALARKQERLVAEILQKDRGVQRWLSPPVLVQVVGGPTGALLVQPRQVVTAQTEEELARHPDLLGFAQVLEFEISQGKVRPVSSQDQWRRLRQLKTEVEVLQRSIEKARQWAALSPLSGPGVVIEASDAPGGYLWDEIVHEEDIVGIVTALFGAGAQGVDVGGVRWQAQTWVRCVGPVVMVRDKAVPANPVVIRAIGDPERLQEAVKPIQEVFARLGKRLTVTAVDSLVLPAGQQVDLQW
ncbi:MAG: DUF881 domain-containing protein [Limnochordales bacterium]|nr:DUF881 domain-containing protein [Limnochordales bacterium]